jgi:hypothetical protein
LKQQEVQAVHTKLDTLISEDSVATLAKQFDAKLGQAGAFKEEVIKRAFLIEKTTGQELTPEQAVQEVVKLYGWNMTGPSQPQDKVLAPKGTSSKASLPTLQGKNTSPVVKQITSLDDLKSLRTRVLKDQRSEVMDN